MSNRRAPVSISLSGKELERLDAWARDHGISRSAAVRVLVMSTRSPGQTVLADFDAEVASEAEAAVQRASEALSSKESVPQPRGIVAQAQNLVAHAKAVRGEVCFGQPSNLLGGRCYGGLRGPSDQYGNPGAQNHDPDAPACPVCWPEGTTAKMTREASRQALAAQRSAQAAPVIEEALRRFFAEGEDDGQDHD